MNPNRTQRDRLEQLQAELRLLEARQRATRERLHLAREVARTAWRRESAASRQRSGPLLAVGQLKALGTGLARVSLTVLVVLAVFGAVLGTVTFAIHRYTQSTTRTYRE